MGAFKIFVDPKDGEIVVAFPQPVMGFETVDDLEEVLTEMLNELPDIRMALLGEKPNIPKNYAMDVMKEFHQALLTDTLKEIKDKKEGTEDESNSL